MAKTQRQNHFEILSKFVYKEGQFGFMIKNLPKGCEEECATLALISSYEFLETFAKEHFIYGGDSTLPEFIEKLKAHINYNSEGIFDMDSAEGVEKMNEVLGKNRI